MGVFVALLIFSVVILVHEFGHFIFAKMNHVGVIEFSLGMGPRLLSKQIGDTRFSLKLLPIGGSCNMVGEDMASDAEDSFGNTSVWSRISIVFGGPLFNFILAFMLALIVIGIAGYDPAVLHNLGTKPTSILEAGLQDGDKIIELDGVNIYNYREIVDLLSMNKDAEAVEFVYERNGEINSTVVIPERTEDGRYFYGLPSMGIREKGSIIKVLQYSILELRYWIKTTILSLKELILGNITMDHVSGPVGIVNFIGGAYKESSKISFLSTILEMLNISILLSANLGIINLLPIPALDGGRLFFLLVEAVIKKRLNQNIEGFIHFIGFVLLMFLMIFVLYNDIRHLIR